MTLRAAYVSVYNLAGTRLHHTALTSGQLFQQPTSTCDRISDLQFFLSYPDARSHGMNHRNSEVVLHCDNVLHLPGARAEQIDPLCIGKLIERGLQMLIDRVRRNFIGVIGRRIHAFHAEHFKTSIAKITCKKIVEFFVVEVSAAHESFDAERAQRFGLRNSGSEDRYLVSVFPTGDALLLGFVAAQHPRGPPSRWG